MNFSQNELLQMIQMDKDVITAILNHIITTDVINGYNEGQMKEARLEIDRLSSRILDKASLVDGLFMKEQEIYLKSVADQLNNIDSEVIV